MTRNTTKSAAAERIYKLAMAARAVQRIKNGGCCGRKPSSKRKRRAFKRSSLNKEASRDLMRKIACAVAVIQRTRGLQKTAGDTPIYKNPIAIGTAGGGLIGGTLGAILGPKGQKFLSGLAGAGLGAAAGAGAGYGYTKLKKKPEEEKKEEEKIITVPDPLAPENIEVVSGPSSLPPKGVDTTLSLPGYRPLNKEEKRRMSVIKKLYPSMSGREAMLYAQDPEATQRLVNAKDPTGGYAKPITDALPGLTNPLKVVLDTGRSYYRHNIAPEVERIRESAKSDEIQNKRMEAHPHNPGAEE